MKKSKKIYPIRIKQLTICVERIEKGSERLGTLDFKDFEEMNIYRRMFCDMYREIYEELEEIERPFIDDDCKSIVPSELRDLLDRLDELGNRYRMYKWGDVN